MSSITKLSDVPKPETATLNRGDGAKVTMTKPKAKTGVRHTVTHRQLQLTLPNDLYKCFDLARAAEQTTIDRVMADPEQAAVAKTSTVGFMVMLMCMGFERFVEAVAEGEKATRRVLSPVEAAQEQRSRA